MKPVRNRRLPTGKIEKPEDKIWRQQFDKLTKDDHLEKLHMLGLDDEEVEELAEDFEEVKKGKKGKILQELEEEVGPAPEEGVEQGTPHKKHAKTVEAKEDEEELDEE
ncbi:MAG: hypothetical protein IPJ89_00990 [Candidatus Iainarchaeum archaeon]|uniref:Uncharacterized protein n=1 Tax=Candidatus Iainarchaeum sp. TaxID=3101447 RepID=A0A7T9DK54_9ARCH|nr:MAG: hypothetical protein IPJ89_00990 [Candidatus Diapherotrites archaeon]